MQIIINLLGQSEVACINRKAERYIGLNRIQALILQTISTDFVYQTNAPAFLAQIYDNATPFFLNGLHCCLKLRAAITFHRK